MRARARGASRLAAGGYGDWLVGWGPAPRRRWGCANTWAGGWTNSGGAAVVEELAERRSQPSASRPATGRSARRSRRSRRCDPRVDLRELRDQRLARARTTRSRAAPRRTTPGGHRPSRVVVPAQRRRPGTRRSPRRRRHPRRASSRALARRSSELPLLRRRLSRRGRVLVIRRHSLGNGRRCPRTRATRRRRTKEWARERGATRASGGGVSPPDFFMGGTVLTSEAEGSSGLLPQHLLHALQPPLASFEEPLLLPRAPPRALEVGCGRPRSC